MQIRVGPGRQYFKYELDHILGGYLLGQPFHLLEQLVLQSFQIGPSQFLVHYCGHFNILTYYYISIIRRIGTWVFKLQYQNMQYNRGQWTQQPEDPELAGNVSEDKKKIRRTKKDEAPRKFSCPCGKSYLSYPALYTHVKTKHQGKNNYLEVKPAESKSEQRQPEEPRNHLEQIGKSISYYFWNSSSTVYSENTNEEIRRLIATILEGIPTEINPENPQKNKRESIHSIFCNFQVGIISFVPKEGYAYLQHFIHQFISFLNEEKKDSTYCMKNNGSELPNYFNQFILRKRAPYFDDGNKSLQSSLVLACKVLYHLGAWLNGCGYSEFAIKYNPGAQ